LENSKSLAIIRHALYVVGCPHSIIEREAKNLYDQLERLRREEEGEASARRDQMVIEDSGHKVEEGYLELLGGKNCDDYE